MQQVFFFCLENRKVNGVVQGHEHLSRCWLQEMKYIHDVVKDLNGKGVMLDSRFEHWQCHDLTVVFHVYLNLDAEAWTQDLEWFPKLLEKGGEKEIGPARNLNSNNSGFSFLSKVMELICFWKKSTHVEHRYLIERRKEGDGRRLWLKAGRKKKSV
jgi:hypothetical protein